MTQATGCFTVFFPGFPRNAPHLIVAYQLIAINQELYMVIATRRYDTATGGLAVSGVTTAAIDVFKLPGRPLVRGV
ncbi:hypothetical protein D3C81_1727800 [compost metagenome]